MVRNDDVVDLMALLGVERRLCNGVSDLLRETDPELKGRWTEPPAEKRRFFGVLE